MTIFLTTQYLEEADELADRVGIINGGTHRGRGHARGAEAHGRHRPRSSSRSTATRRRRAASSRRSTASTRVDARGSEVVIARTTDGAAAVSPVAVALSRRGVRVRDLTLRTPTLDDVFLELTGNRIQEGDR